MHLSAPTEKNNKKEKEHNQANRLIFLSRPRPRCRQMGVIFVELITGQYPKCDRCNEW